MTSSRRTLLTSAVKLQIASDYWVHRLHAMLGLYVASHFLYRYLLFFTRHEDMGFDSLKESVDSKDTPYATVFAILFLPHFLLQLSGLPSLYQANVTQMAIEFGHSIDGKHYCSVPAAYHYHSLHGGEKLMVGNLMTALVASYQQYFVYYSQ